jgi:hypothetical protein
VRERAIFGGIRTSAGESFANVTYGWRHTGLPIDLPDTPNPRPPLAGDAGAFEADENDKYKLPVDFQDAFFNGGRAQSAHLSPGQQVFFNPGGGDSADEVHVTIPPRPTVTVVPPAGPAPAVTTRLDTVIYDESAARFILIYRATFPWDDSLITGSLVVSE